MWSSQTILICFSVHLCIFEIKRILDVGEAMLAKYITFHWFDGEEILSDRYYGAVYILDIHKQTIIFWDGCNALKP